MNLFLFHSPKGLFIYTFIYGFVAYWKTASSNSYFCWGSAFQYFFQEFSGFPIGWYTLHLFIITLFCFWSSGRWIGQIFSYYLCILRLWIIGVRCVFYIWYLTRNFFQVVLFSLGATRLSYIPWVFNPYLEDDIRDLIIGLGFYWSDHGQGVGLPWKFFRSNYSLLCGCELLVVQGVLHRRYVRVQSECSFLTIVDSSPNRFWTFTTSCWIFPRQHVSIYLIAHSVWYRSLNRFSGARIRVYLYLVSGRYDLSSSIQTGLTVRSSICDPGSLKCYPCKCFLFVISLV